METPWISVETKNPYARTFHHGDLDFKEDAKKEILVLLQTVPTIVMLYPDRPAVIPESNAAAKANEAAYNKKSLSSWHMVKKKEIAKFSIYTIKVVGVSSQI
ncbi:MAG: hypothetical protein H7Y59_03665 [Anaerolineales bacterium]|nr:hypothetical protein [Anaerolineales bacterium]